MNQHRMSLIHLAKEALQGFLDTGDKTSLKISLDAFAKLGATPEAVLQMERQYEQKRLEYPEKVRAWKALPVEERKAILEMSRS